MKWQDFIKRHYLELSETIWQIIIRNWLFGFILNKIILQNPQCLQRSSQEKWKPLAHYIGNKNK